ncbi:MAG: hypothetical protein HUU03_15060 [Planctomycetaceae bacterium]|nr:hypothetical protein [Planctomycetaceae bacterium]HRJ79028.1 hypothetical protein [Planctomycetota bacterium]
MVGTWEPVINTLKAAAGAIPPGILESMRAQAQAFEKQMMEDSGFEVPGYSTSTELRRPAGHLSDQELVGEIRRLLIKKNRRPQDLAYLLNEPKERIERILESNTDQFQRAEEGGARGWWERVPESGQRKS